MNLSRIKKLTKLGSIMGTEVHVGPTPNSMVLPSAMYGAMLTSAQLEFSTRMPDGQVWKSVWVIQQEELAHAGIGRTLMARYTHHVRDMLDKQHQVIKDIVYELDRI